VYVPIHCNFMSVSRTVSDAFNGREGFRRDIAIRFGVEKLECVATRRRKMFNDTFSCFDRIPACDRQTGRQTHRQTSCDSIVRAMRSITL